ncbi:hypothetical protein BO86DRAFT_140848 [Aspergillus japonicus CBS 114.51]|uniref:Uncharacterized protein n=1 Tax=Aspergillus japonicus CBS 114.51 TaxID=1448312 RepID=A0A8T8XDL2_ASPJA|nr:hypothetical protein BO86DRAFT_140848 [Aspergillus japonicus CBS 114.51]RAH86235.1 hypothetical protein BO86DRAFT_140848 [Aspergillus japonicus CBS 114.51]
MLVPCCWLGVERFVNFWNDVVIGLSLGHPRILYRTSRGSEYRNVVWGIRKPPHANCCEEPCDRRLRLRDGPQVRARWVRRVEGSRPKKSSPPLPFLCNPELRSRGKNDKKYRSDAEMWYDQNPLLRAKMFNNLTTALSQPTGPQSDAAAACLGHPARCFHVVAALSSSSCPTFRHPACALSTSYWSPASSG